MRRGPRSVLYVRAAGKSCNHCMQPRPTARRSDCGWAPAASKEPMKAKSASVGGEALLIRFAAPAWPWHIGLPLEALAHVVAARLWWETEAWPIRHVLTAWEVAGHTAVLLFTYSLPAPALLHSVHPTHIRPCRALAFDSGRCYSLPNCARKWHDPFYYPQVPRKLDFPQTSTASCAGCRILVVDCGRSYSLSNCAHKWNDPF